MKAKLHVLIRRIKRSFKSDREQWIKGGILAAILLVIIIFAGSCACSRKNVKEPDAASQGVMKITPIPSPTPTVAPRQVNKDAIHFQEENQDGKKERQSGAVPSHPVLHKEM